MAPLDALNADLKLDDDNNKDDEPKDLEPGEHKEVVVEVAGVAHLAGAGGVRAGDAAVDVLIAHVEEEDALEEVDGRRAHQAADALHEPEEPHHDALHRPWRMRVGQLEACRERIWR